MKKVLIVNPGVQPEIQKIVSVLNESGFEVKYSTASSFGVEFKSKYFAREDKISSRIRRIFARRVMEFSEDLVVRYGFIFEFISFILFRLFGLHCRPVRNLYFYSRVFFFIFLFRPDLVIFQDSIPLLFRSNRVVKTCIKILIVSTASPMYFASVYEFEKKNNANWSRFFLSSGFSKKKQRRYLSDCEYADYVITPSNFVATDLGKYVERDKIKVVRLGFSLESLGIQAGPVRSATDDSASGLKVIFIGQLSQRKGLSYLLDGFFKARIPKDSILTLVGTSVLGSRTYILKNYKSKQLTLRGHLSRSELGELLSQHDLFVMPSLIEGFCLSAIEALGSGIAVAVTDVVLDEIIVNEKNGFLIEKHSVEAISNLLEKVFADKKNLVDVGIEGCKLASNFTWTVYQKQMYEFICQVIDSDL